MDSSLRYLADSNRRTRFCRPLTKPLIQGTGCISDYKGKTFFVKNKQRCPFFTFLIPFWAIIQTFTHIIGFKILSSQ